MNSLSNAFSILSLDQVDDVEQIVTVADTKLQDKSKEDSESLEGSNNKSDIGVPVESLGEYKQPLVWIDLEMTGLDVEVDRILEIACIVTDGRLTKSIEGPDLVIRQPKESLDSMGDWCKKHHSASGLTKKVLHSKITVEDAEKLVVEFIKKHIDSYTPLLAGNSIYVDLLFLKKYMPKLAALFPHVLVDVSSIAALCVRWYPKDRKRAPAKQKNHRAMDDIRESIRELKYYKACIFQNHVRPNR